VRFRTPCADMNVGEYMFRTKKGKLSIQNRNWLYLPKWFTWFR